MFLEIRRKSARIPSMAEMAPVSMIADLHLEPLLEALHSALGNDLLGVVLYGSHARGEASPGSDVDLLVIANGLPERRYERAQWLARVEFESDYTGPQVSILGKTREEFERYFPSLYLDIGQDGIVLFDREEYAAGKLAQIREVIAEAGLVRTWFDGEMMWEITRPVPDPPGYWGIEWDGYHEYAR